jgi:hypothetical protein
MSGETNAMDVSAMTDDEFDARLAARRDARLATEVPEFWAERSRLFGQLEARLQRGDDPGPVLVGLDGLFQLARHIIRNARRAGDIDMADRLLRAANAADGNDSLDAMYARARDLTADRRTLTDLVGELAALSRATGDLIAEVDALLEKGDDALPSERQALAARLGRYGWFARRLATARHELGDTDEDLDAPTVAAANGRFGRRP